MEKAEIRKYILAQRGALTSKYVSGNSDRIFALLVNLTQVKQAKNVMIYSHFANEVRTGKLAGWLLFHGKRVFLPVVNDDSLLAADIGSTCFEMNCYGISQPEKETACFEDPSKIDLFIVPGLAFDRKGNRIGFGKGYYDDLLSKAPDAQKIALAYEFQILDEISAEPHDIKMDILITPKEVIRREED